MAKLFVIAGHGAGDPGACAGGHTEADLVRKLAARMKALGGAEVIVGDTSVSWYDTNGIGRGQCPAGVPVIELHMDSAGAGAKGGHVIIKAGFEPDAYDRALAGFIGEFFPGRANKIVGRSDLANPNRAAAAGVNYRLLECCFISNDGDRGKFINQMDDVARGILKAFGIAAGSAPAPKPEPAPKPSGLDLGDTAWLGPKMATEWQRQRGTHADGCISGQTQYNSEVVQWAITVSPAESPACGSALVVSVQQLLIAKGFGVGASGADGHMGHDTVKALQRFLQANGIGVGSAGVDGYFGNDTSRAVGEALKRGLFRG